MSHSCRTTSETHKSSHISICHVFHGIAHCDDNVDDVTFYITLLRVSVNKRKSLCKRMQPVQMFILSFRFFFSDEQRFNIDLFAKNIASLKAVRFALVCGIVSIV